MSTSFFPTGTFLGPVTKWIVEIPNPISPLWKFLLTIMHKKYCALCDIGQFHNMQKKLGRSLVFSCFRSLSLSKNRNFLILIVDMNDTKVHH
jgi:hypothetical protein